MKDPVKLISRIVSYVLVAALASAVTYYLCQRNYGKLWQLQNLLDERFIGETDLDALQDAAADAMVDALGDRWSYYIPEESFEALDEQHENAYVGIGVTISIREDGQGFDILQVEPGSSAQETGVLPGDILVEVEGQSVEALGTDGARELMRGKEGTQVQVAVLREEQRHTFTLTRKKIQTVVVTAELLDGNIGLVTINNFNERCADEGKAAVSTLLDQGAQALVFDVRNNPGGYVSELTELLDYLLPEGILFQSEDFSGKKQTVKSDASAVEVPMAVLVNGNSYSAAEFFAAALEEYDWAIVAGDPTCGKGYYQTTYKFSDGSGVGLSTGKYFTPNGISLAEVGGLVPEVLVEVDAETAALIYADALDPEEDPQLQAAIKALRDEK